MKDLKEIEKTIQKKYRKEIFSKFVRAIKDFNLIKKLKENIERDGGINEETAKLVKEAACSPSLSGTAFNKNKALFRYSLASSKLPCSCKTQLILL